MHVDAELHAAVVVGVFWSAASEPEASALSAPAADAGFAEDSAPEHVEVLLIVIFDSELCELEAHAGSVGVGVCVADVLVHACVVADAGEESSEHGTSGARCQRGDDGVGRDFDACAVAGA